MAVPLHLLLSVNSLFSILWMCLVQGVHCSRCSCFRGMFGRRLTPAMIIKVRTPPQCALQVIDGALGPAWCGAALSEIQRMHRAGRLHANATHILRSGARQLLPKAGILEAELLDPVRRPHVKPSSNTPGRSYPAGLTVSCGHRACAQRTIGCGGGACMHEGLETVCMRPPMQRGVSLSVPHSAARGTA